MIPEETLLPSGETIRFREFLSLWDTGAYGTSAISERVVEECGLKPVGPVNAVMPLGRFLPYASELYRVNLGLPNHVIIPDLLVLRAQTQDHVDVIIGMDVIRLCDFSITNGGGKTVLSILTPSVASTDFTEKYGGVTAVLGARVE